MINNAKGNSDVYPKESSLITEASPIPITAEKSKKKRRVRELTLNNERVSETFL